MTKPKWPDGPGWFYRQLHGASPYILTGTLVTIDPGSKQPGCAIFHAGEEQMRFEMDLGEKKPIAERLQALNEKMQSVTPEPPDVVAVEEIRGQKFCHDYLKFAVGATIAASRTPIVVSTPINFWRALVKVSDDYEKTNANDAAWIGHALINYCWENQDDLD